MRGGIRSNVRRLEILVGVEDDYAVGLANGLIRSGLTQSPMSRGAQGLDNQGLSGAGVNAQDYLTAPLQQFIGLATTPIVKPASPIGDRLSGVMPGTGNAPSPVAWMDLGKRGGLGFTG